MAHIQGFPPISRADARILILGSMPSRESLAQQQYYAHPRNAFWPIITQLLDSRAESYAQRSLQVLKARIAIWDVLKACFRSSSLDADIDDRSIVANDFAAFYRAHPHIRRVFFNGAKAEQVYRKQVQPGLSGTAAAMECLRLPSTSPANAGMNFEQKRAAWEIVVSHKLYS